MQLRICCPNSLKSPLRDDAGEVEEAVASDWDGGGWRDFLMEYSGLVQCDGGEDSNGADLKGQISEVIM